MCDVLSSKIDLNETNRPVQSVVIKAYMQVGRIKKQQEHLISVVLSRSSVNYLPRQLLHYVC